MWATTAQHEVLPIPFNQPLHRHPTQNPVNGQNSSYGWYEPVGEPE